MRSANAGHAIAVGAIVLTLVVIPSLAAVRSFPSVPVLPSTLAQSGAVAHAQEDVRALQVVRTTLTSSAGTASMVDAAKAGGYFARGMATRPATLAAPAPFDPLETTIARAHDAGLQ